MAPKFSRDYVESMLRNIAQEKSWGEEETSEIIKKWCDGKKVYKLKEQKEQKEQKSTKLDDELPEVSLKEKMKVKEEVTSSKSEKKSSIDALMCKALVWSKTTPHPQCSRKCKPGSDFCGMHKKNQRYGVVNECKSENEDKKQEDNKEQLPEEIVETPILEITKPKVEKVKKPRGKKKRDLTVESSDGELEFDGEENISFNSRISPELKLSSSVNSLKDLMKSQASESEDNNDDVDNDYDNDDDDHTITQPIMIGGNHYLHDPKSNILYTPDPDNAIEVGRLGPGNSFIPYESDENVEESSDNESDGEEEEDE